MRQMSRMALLLITGVFLGAADTPPSDVVARRGDLQLTTEDVREALSHIDPAARTQVLNSPPALQEFVRDRLLRLVLLKEAREAKWDEKPDIVARANDVRDTMIMQSWLSSRAQPDAAFPSQSELAAAYEANKPRFAVPKQYHVTQLAILVPPNASKDVDDEARRKIRDLRQQATKPKADFAEIARKASEDKNSADRGGDLGWVREDQIVPPIRDAVKGLAENAVSEPIRSADAYHVVKVLGTRPPTTMTLDQVKDNLVGVLRQAKAQQATKAYLEELLRKEPAQINEVGLAARVAPPK